VALGGALISACTAGGSTSGSTGSARPCARQPQTA